MTLNPGSRIFILAYPSFDNTTQHTRAVLHTLPIHRWSIAFVMHGINGAIVDPSAIESCFRRK